MGSQTHHPSVVYQCYYRGGVGILPCNALPTPLSATILFLSTLPSPALLAIHLGYSSLPSSFYFSSLEFRSTKLVIRRTSHIRSIASPPFLSGKFWNLLLAVARNHRLKMGKKKTAAEKVEAAREKGFNDDMTGIDDRPVLRKILDYSKGLYDMQMEVWREYEKDHPGVIPYNLRTLKHFAELLASAAVGQLEEKPTEDTVRGYMQRFTSGYERDTGICIPEQMRKTATNHIKTLGLSKAHRPKHCLTLKKYKILASVVNPKRQRDIAARLVPIFNASLGNASRSASSYAV
ncbi:hypothetical protein G7Y89_g15080 [Cudoniella acicularis]|uniref:Uncharacterized protein n=1 Tax=Cudoniella acicularis TaxID=354080 RepID=A0A8H4VPC4_9HELO|nr:hypothetical protein G7Y89_g15080 [Cudoniella acicularis]